MSQFIICQKHGSTRQGFYLACQHVRQVETGELAAIGMANNNPLPVAHCLVCDPQRWGDKEFFTPFCIRCFEERPKL